MATTSFDPSQSLHTNSLQSKGSLPRSEPTQYKTYSQRLWTATEQCLSSANTLREYANVLAADYLFAPAFATVPGVAKKVGEFVGNFLIYPNLSNEVIRAEARFTKLSFDPKAILSLSAPHKHEVRTNFTRETHEFSLDNVIQGQNLKVHYLVMESKWGNDSLPAHNLVLFPGNIGSIEVNQDIRAFARAFLEKMDKSNAPKVRLIVVSARDITTSDGKTYKPPFAQTGLIHKAILDHLMGEKKYGKISQVVGISLGCAVIAKLMDAIDAGSMKDYPQNWWLHVGLSSMEEVSKLHWFGRALLMPVAQQSGWDVDSVGALERYCKKVESLEMKGEVFIGVSGLYGDVDHHFPWKASLCNSDKIKALKEQGSIGEVLHFKPSHMEQHVRAHHALSMDLFDLTQLVNPATGDYVVHPMDETNSSHPSPEECFIPPGEHLAGAIVRQALIKKESLKKEN